MSRILSALKGLRCSYHHFYLNAEFRKDLRWWQLMLPHFHAISMIKCQPWSFPDDIIATDACLQGGGGTFRNSYFTCKFPVDLLDVVSGINHLEAITFIEVVG